MSDIAAKTLSISGCSVATLLTAGETFKSTFKDALIDMLTPRREEPPDAEVLISFFMFWYLLVLELWSANFLFFS